MEEATTLCILYDTFRQIVSIHTILSPADIIAFSLTCSRFREWTIKYISDSNCAAGGYPSRSSLIKTFTCYCGRIGWQVRKTCVCFTTCGLCKRRLPERLVGAECIYRTGYCGFPCERHCSRCNLHMNAENVDDFRFVRGYLRCKEHYDYKESWYSKASDLISIWSLKSYEGPIQLDDIAKNDPDHGILSMRKDTSSCSPPRTSI